MNDEQEMAAAEYVLGTLPAAERAAFSAELANDSALQASVRRWQMQLASLDATAASERPPAGTWLAIARMIASGRAAAEPSSVAGPAADTTVVQLRRRVAAWRGATIAAGALAAGLAVLLILDRTGMETVAPPEGRRYVAVVDTGGHEPALIAEVDTATGLIRVRSIAAETPAGSSLELWHVAEGHPPRSLGVLAPGDAPQLIQDAVVTVPLQGQIAVSVEPQGGSPSGAPTGPVVYSGRLIPVE